jgi:hypothetical protein
VKWLYRPCGRINGPVLLIVELLAAWFGLSLVLGLPLGRAIRRADVREYPLRDSPWWSESDGARTTRRARAVPV